MSDGNATITDLKQLIEDFVSERDWSQFHSAKNLSMAISIESVDDIDSGYLFNATRAQRTFGGVRVRGKLYKDAYYYDDEFSELMSEAEIVVCKDGVKIALFEEKITL